MAIVVNRSGNQDIDGILWGWRWDDNNFTYSFPTAIGNYGGYAAINGFEAFNSAQQAAVTRILANLSSFANVTFTQVGGSTAAELRYAEANSVNYTNSSTVAGHWGLHTIGSAEANPPELAYAGNPPLSAIYAQGDSWYNHTSYNTPGLGSYAYAAGLMHETGHNLGLKHGQSAQYGHGTTFPTLPANHDSIEYSVMTYAQFVGDTDTVDNAPEHPTTYMQDDIAALQYMYGANYNYLNGNTTYSWSATTGQEFINGVGQGQPISNFILMTVWDGGGVDTYDFTNYTTNLSVDLNPGGWTITSLDQLADLGNDNRGGAEHYARGSIANAQLYQGNTASLIENALGGSGNDTFFLYAYNVNNLIDGNGGTDEVVLPYAFGQGYTVSGTLTNLSLSGVEGTDTFQDIELFQFANGVTRTAAELLAGSQPGGSTMPDGDFNRDGWSDVLWRNATTGAWGYMDSHAGNAWHDGPTFPTSYNIAGTGDFNHDGYSDVMWRNNATGAWGYSDVRGGTWNDLGGSSAAYVIAGIGDFNRDGWSDLLWRNNATGAWEVHDVRNHTWNDMGASSAAYLIAGVGDFNHDGTSDVLWRNDTNGSWGWTDMQSHAFHDLGGSATSSRIVGVGDFNADGWSDVLWRNPTTGDMAYTDMRNGSQNAFATSSTAYAIVDVSDPNHDGYSDVVMRNNANGNWGFFDSRTHAWNDLGASSTAWSIAST
jgi:peptidase M10/serralysin-like protein